nr:thioesterase family protein [Acidimicrobiia bacterium]
IPMAGFRVQAEVRRPGRSVTFTEAEILDEDRIYVRAYGMHMRRLDFVECPTAPFEVPPFEAAIPGDFPIHQTTHGLLAFPSSMEVRYDPGSSIGGGGPTTVWMRTRVPILADEEPSPFQRISPLADCGNGISHNQYLDEMFFVNPDLDVSLHRDPVGEWFCSKAVSHWQSDGTGLADAELYDVEGPVGRAVQNLLLTPVERA